jgi:hypothetical protein
MEQHIGLGHGARILSLDVWWPATNTRQQFSNVDKNEFIAIKEFDPGYSKLVRQSHRLGGSTADVPAPDFSPGARAAAR